MKEHTVKITCDKCGKKIEFIDGTGYPYKEGWNYIQSFYGKFAKKHTHKLHADCEQLQLANKHFCSQKCTIKFLGDSLEEVYKTPKVQETNERVIENDYEDPFGEE